MLKLDLQSIANDFVSGRIELYVQKIIIINTEVYLSSKVPNILQ